MDNKNLENVIELLIKQGFSLRLEENKLRYKAPKENITEETLSLLKKNKESIIEYLQTYSTTSVFSLDKEKRFEKFPLTDVQAAYLFGRRELFEYGGVACHVYLELKYKELDVERVREAWERLIKRHDMLRAVFYEDGSQQVLENIPKLEIPYWDVRTKNTKNEYEAFRKEMGKRIYNIGEWPMFGVAVAQMEQTAILHFSMEFLVADWTSIWMLLSEFETLYFKGNDSLIDAPEATFRDYLLAENKLKDSMQYKKAENYWKTRMLELPEAPELPILSPESAKNSFKRKMLRLQLESWDRIKEKAQKYGITPTVAILTTYADAIRKWSQNKNFCINLTVLNRYPLCERVSDIVGDFTTLDLLEIHGSDQDRFVDRAKAINSRLFEDLDNRLFSGVEVLRELSKKRNRRINMPIVYTSAIGLSDQNNQIIGQFYDGITQTPQVFIDCQAMDGNFGLQINWDVREGVFPEGLIDDMFDSFKKRIEFMAKEDSDWNESGKILLPVWQSEERNKVNDTEQVLPTHRLGSGFREWAKKEPHRIAIDDGMRKYTYAELDKVALTIKQQILDSGIGEQKCIAIIMEKSAYQVAAVLGILYANCIYVPIIANQAEGRAKRILEITQSAIVLTTSGDRKEYMRSIPTIEVDKLSVMDTTDELIEGKLDDIAYIIFTSGSTGEPKGVTITHHAAVNTIEDMNRRFLVGADDTVLGLSRLNFDLSVFDIFGLLEVGGKIIYPIESQYMNPEYWLRLIMDNRITIWNSVPALMKMMLTELDTIKQHMNLPLEKVFLSGDWIPVDMPSKIRNYASNAEIICLGGATEASIWSIYHKYEGNEYANSIPYGKPLANQKMDIVDIDRESCPVWVPGEIVIKGTGLSVGYFGDNELTNQKFVIDPYSKERMYLTGDVGRYLPGGDIEFIGRNDNQVKIRGHRIELGEIENVLKKVNSVKDAVAVVDAAKNEIAVLVEPSLVSAEVVCDRKKNCAALHDEIKDFDMEFFDQIDWEKARKSLHIRNYTAAYSLLYGLQSLGILKSGIPMKVADIKSVSTIPTKYKWLVDAWIDVLLEHNFIQKQDNGSVVAVMQLDQETYNQNWKNAFENWDTQLGSVAILEYIKDNADNFQQILCGNVDPVSLLYPNGSNKYTQALYVKNTIAEFINNCIFKIVNKLKEQIGERKIRILEIGGGTGATTDWVLKALEGCDFEYCFTDISKYFFPEAMKKYEGNKSVRIKQLNLDEDFLEQGFYPNTFDVVIGAYVLNNVKDIRGSIGRLQSLIKPAGYLIFSETSAADAWLLISQALMMTKAEDQLRENHVFISPLIWKQILNDCDNTESSIVIPEISSISNILGANLFIKQFKSDRAIINEKDLRKYAEIDMPSYMIPAEICVIDQIPLSVNGKVDRKVVKEWFELQSKAVDKTGVQEETKTDIEQSICDIWCEALDIAEMGKQENFYDYGADSLIMAQVTTKIRNILKVAIPFDALLRQMLNTPTVEEIAKYITDYKEERIDETQTTVSFEHIVRSGKQKDDRGRILLHGALGSVEVYKYLIPELEKQDLGEIITISISDTNKYCELETDEVIHFLADLYAESILNLNIPKVQLIGYSFSGAVVIEVANRLLEAGIDVEDVAVIDGGSIPVEIKDEIIFELLFIGNIHVSLEKIGFGDSAIFEKVFGNVINSGREYISIEDFLDNEGGETHKLLLTLNEMSQEERFLKYINASEDANMKDVDIEVLKRLYRIFQQSFKALRSIPSTYFGDIRYFKTKERTGIFKYFEALLQEWNDVCIGDFETIDINGNHYSCLENPQNARELAEQLGKFF